MKRTTPIRAESVNRVALFFTERLQQHHPCTRVLTRTSLDNFRRPETQERIVREFVDELKDDTAWLELNPTRPEILRGARRAVKYQAYGPRMTQIFLFTNGGLDASSNIH